MANSDDTFAKYVLQTGMATDAQIARAKKRQSESSRSGAASALPEIMVAEGIITNAQRENVEKKLKTQGGGIQQLGNYKLIKKLGEGGMGTVYLAEDTVAYRKVALKVLIRSLSTNPEFLGRFRREAQALGRLNHPNIVAGFNVGEDKGYQFYVMEYCEGEPLDKRLKREKKMNIADVIEISTQVARGLQYAHERNTIHRDIKPGNIFITNDKVVKILDMGLSKTIGESDNSFNTQAGVTVGTPHYISPEQARGRQDIDGRCDIYSLGATMYHFITGQTPFEGPTSAVIMTKHLTDQLPNPCDLRPDCPPGLVHIITKMMAKKPDDRYLNCAELVEDLEQVAVGKAPSSPALDPVHSSVGMRSLRIGTGKFKPVGNDRESENAPPGSSGAMKSKRATGKRDPVIPAEDRVDRPIQRRATGEQRTTRSGRLAAGSVDPEPQAAEPEVPVRSVAAAEADVAAPKKAPSGSAQSSRQEPATPEEAAEPAKAATQKKAAPIALAGVGAVVVLGLGLYFAFGNKGAQPTPVLPDKKTEAVVVMASATATATSTTAAVIPSPPPPSPVPAPAPQIPLPAPAINISNPTPPVPKPKVPGAKHDYTETLSQLDGFLKQRNFARAQERLDVLVHDVNEFDMYSQEWCGRLETYERAVSNGESNLKADFFKDLVGPNDAGNCPKGAVQLFHGGFQTGGTDGRVHWSPRTIKYLSNKLPWVDGLGDSQKLSFDAPNDLLNPEAKGGVSIEYNALIDADAVVKFYSSEDKFKEFSVNLPPGRLKKVEVTPGNQLKGEKISKITVEFNSREYVLAVYKIYLTKQP